MSVATLEESPVAVVPRSVDSLEKRLSAIDWTSIRGDIDANGFAVAPRLLATYERRALVDAYSDTARFRSRIDMTRYRLGRGEYQYFAYPLPATVATLRRHVYAALAPLANEWAERLDESRRFPRDLDEFLARCHAAGQTRPTPLLLRYRTGDYNCLHQDLYGEHVFPLQMAALLDEPGVDFDGGELVLTEQRPRAQSRAHVVPLRGGDAVIFAVDRRPVRGSRGWFRSAMRHGVSALRTGERHTLGVIFHDAR